MKRENITGSPYPTMIVWKLKFTILHVAGVDRGSIMPGHSVREQDLGLTNQIKRSDNVRVTNQTLHCGWWPDSQKTKSL